MKLCIILFASITVSVFATSQKPLIDTSHNRSQKSKDSATCKITMSPEGMKPITVTVTCKCTQLQACDSAKKLALKQLDN